MVSTNDEVQQTASADVQIEQETSEIKSISEEDLVKAQKSFQQGKKNLVLNKYAESVNNIEEACSVYSAKYGEFDSQCAEVYFYFGKALLELARVENNVLGNALTGVPEDTGPIDDSRYGNPDEIAQEEKEEISDKVIDAMCTSEENQSTETAAAAAATTENGTTETPVEKKTEEETLEKKPEPVETTDAVEKKPEETTTSEEKKTEGEEAEEEGEDEEESEDDEETAGKEGAESAEDISNLQRAWEMFELAKLVYSKNFNEDIVFKNKRVAECLLKLGEIGIEQELYEQASNDIKESIRLQEEQKDEDRDERMLAESYYQQALAQQFNNQFDDAKESFQRALNILQLRIEKLRGRLETEQIDEDEKNKLREEIADIEALLPELNGKLEEVNEQDKQSMAAIQEAKECFMNNIGTNGSLNPAAVNNGDVKDITSMMKSKRKISGPQEDVNGLKKTRLSANGAPSSSNDDQMQSETTETAPVEIPIVTDENKEANENKPPTTVESTTEAAQSEPIATQ